MTTRNQSFLTSFAWPQRIALLLSVVVTTLWLGAVLAGFDAVGKPEPRRIELATVTVTYKVPAKFAELRNADVSVKKVASAD